MCRSDNFGTSGINRKHHIRKMKKSSIEKEIRLLEINYLCTYFVYRIRHIKRNILIIFKL